MAISMPDCYLWEYLRSAALLPENPKVLEIGEANWWGDVDPKSFLSDRQIESANKSPYPHFALARFYYYNLLNPYYICSIDMNGTEHALQHDLNLPFSRPEWGLFDIVINTGTAEHVFNQYQVFKTIHDVCKVGGLMVHDAPWRGWSNHGFYCYQPCFWDDLAKANGYEVLKIIMADGDQVGPVESFEQAAKIGTLMPLGNTMLVFALRKTTAAEFKIPQQGRYSR